MKSIYFISAMMLFTCVKGYTQSNPRMEDENYMYTEFYDGFDGLTLNRNFWNASHNGKKEDGGGCNIWVDDVNTLNQANGYLNLTMLYSPGYTTTTWDGKVKTADYISGEVTSCTPLPPYGSFECRVKYAHQKGSWPAFWAIGGDGIPCEQGGGAGDEIDISEFWSYTVCNHPRSNPPTMKL